MNYSFKTNEALLCTQLEAFYMLGMFYSNIGL